MISFGGESGIKAPHKAGKKQMRVLHAIVAVCVPCLPAIQQPRAPRMDLSIRSCRLLCS